MNTPIIGTIPFYYHFCSLIDNEHNTFVERLDYIYKVNRIDDEEIKKLILLTHIETSLYIKIRAACGSSGPPKLKTYDELLALLQANCTATDPCSRVYELRRRFYEFRMTADQLVAEYARNVELNAEQCRFVEGRDDILRDQFIVGLTKELQTAFFEHESTGMTFKDAVAIATKVEIAIEIRNGPKQVIYCDGTVSNVTLDGIRNYPR